MGQTHVHTLPENLSRLQPAPAPTNAPSLLASAPQAKGSRHLYKSTHSTHSGARLRCMREKRGKTRIGVRGGPSHALCVRKVEWDNCQSADCRLLAGACRCLAPPLSLAARPLAASHPCSVAYETDSVHSRHPSLCPGKGKRSHTSRKDWVATRHAPRVLSILLSGDLAARHAPRVSSILLSGDLGGQLQTSGTQC